MRRNSVAWESQREGVGERVKEVTDTRGRGWFEPPGDRTSPLIGRWGGRSGAIWSAGGMCEAGVGALPGGRTGLGSVGGSEGQGGGWAPPWVDDPPHPPNIPQVPLFFRGGPVVVVGAHDSP